MIDIRNPEIHFAIDAVRQASQLVAAIQRDLVTASLVKEDRSPVTVADFASQAIVAYMLNQTFPNKVLVAEEDATALRLPQSQDTLDKIVRYVQQVEPTATPQQICQWIDYGKGRPQSRYWTLDPIDGTKGFIRGDQYAIALALIIDQQVQIGVLGCPKLNPQADADQNGPGAIFIAVRGEGTWSSALDNPTRFEHLQVSHITDPQQARLLRSFESGHTNVSQIDEFAQKMGLDHQPISMDSQAKYAVLAAGKGELLMRLLTPSQPNYREKIWDQAAGSIIIEEAGGRISDLTGKPLHFLNERSLIHNLGILASNGHLHSIALQTLQAIGAVPQQT